MSAPGRYSRARPTGSYSSGARWKSDAHVGAHQQHPLGAALVEVPPAVDAGLVHLGRVVGVLHGHDPVAPAHELARQRDGQRGLSGVLPADDGDDSSRRHSSSVRARSSAVFTLKNRSSGSPKPRDLGQGEDTDADALMEGDGPEIAPVEAAGDGVAAGRTVPGAERLDPAPAAALAAGRRRAAQALAPAGGAGPRTRTACPRRRRTTGAGASTTAV